MNAAPNVGPLTGNRVVVLEGLGPGPFVAMLLADMGAEVIRVKRPSHRSGRPLAQTLGLSPERDVINRGTASVEIDLKDSQGLKDLKELIMTAEVFMEGFRPGVAERLGLGPDELIGINPRLVYARVTGYGQSGQMSKSAGHDINYVAQSGALNAMAAPGLKPRPPVNLLGDYAGGGALGAYGIVCALLEAKSSGNGQVVDVAMLDGVALLTAKMQGLRSAGLFSDDPGTNYIDGGAPFYDTYQCADGRYIAVAALEADFYKHFLDGLSVETSQWPEQEDRARWPELRQHIADAFATKTMKQWAEIFDGTDACVSAVLNFDEATTHSHNAERQLFIDVDGVNHPAPAPRLSRTPARRPGQPPRERVELSELLGKQRI